MAAPPQTNWPTTREIFAAMGACLPDGFNSGWGLGLVERPGHAVHGVAKIDTTTTEIQLRADALPGLRAGDLLDAFTYHQHKSGRANFVQSVTPGAVPLGPTMLTMIFPGPPGGFETALPARFLCWDTDQERLLFSHSL